MLHEVNIAVTKGSDIRTMRELLLAHDLLPPTFESTRRPDPFVATFLFHHFLGPEDLAWLRRLTREAISDEKARALVFVRELGAIDNTAYRAINRTDTLNASVQLRRLRDLDLLAIKGSGSRTHYVPGALFAAAPAVAGDDATTGGEMVTRLEPDSHQPGTDGHQWLVTIPTGIRARLPAALNRTEHKPLVRDYLSPMVREGLLAYSMPAMENHPDQRCPLPAEAPKPWVTSSYTDSPQARPPNCKAMPPT